MSARALEVFIGVLTPYVGAEGARQRAWEIVELLKQGAGKRELWEAMGRVDQYPEVPILARDPLVKELMKAWERIRATE